MRVISGRAKGMRLETLSGLDTRPTAERVKEAVFSSLHFDLPGSSFLDLFAGSGQMGIEALSRGAGHAAFADKNPAAVQIIKNNIKKTGLESSAEIFNLDYKDFARRCKRKFDFVFLDPPFGAGMVLEAVSEIADNVAENGVIIAECEEVPPENVCGFTIFKQARYGKINVCYFRRD